MCSAWRSSTAATNVFLIAPDERRKGAILNLEKDRSVTGWGRLIFYVADVDAIWAYLWEKGFHPESPRDASWGERYFHMADPDGHECHLRVRYETRPDCRENRPQSCAGLD